MTAVLGNNDAGLTCKETELVLLAGRKFLVHHIVNVGAPDESIRRRIDCEKPGAVIFGHSHQLFARMIGCTLYFNPGYAGKPRFKLRRSVAILHCDASGIYPEFKLI